MVKVAFQGLGHIGRETAKLVLQDDSMELVGAIDTNQELVGKDLGELLGTESTGVTVSDDAGAVFKATEADIVVLATTSKLYALAPQIMTAVTNKVNVVSPSEELLMPTHPGMDEEHRDINHKIALFDSFQSYNHNVTVQAAGVNPGCLMDRWPAELLRDIQLDELVSMTVRRWDDTSERRHSLLKKTGAGLQPEWFKKFEESEGLGHVGLEASASYLANEAGLFPGGFCERIEFERTPVVAEKNLYPVHGYPIKKGSVAGIKERCTVYLDDVGKLTLHLDMHVGATNSNRVNIIGIKDGETVHIKDDYSNIVNGDIATSIILKDYIPRVVKAHRGWNTMTYVPNPHELLRREK